MSGLKLVWQQRSVSDCVDDDVGFDDDSHIRVGEWLERRIHHYFSLTRIIQSTVLPFRFQLGQPYYSSRRTSSCMQGNSRSKKLATKNSLSPPTRSWR